MSMFFLGDYETKEICSKKELNEYFQFRKENDVNGNPYCMECHIIGVADAPLLFPTIRKEAGMDEENMSDDAMFEASKDNQIMLICPLEDKWQTYPVRYTAYPDILAMAGLQGRTMTLTEKRRAYNPLPAELKGQWLTTALHLNEQSTQVLVRDGKIEHFKGPTYQVLPEWDGSDALEDYLKVEFPQYKFSEGYVSHEMLSVLWDTCAEDGCNSLKATFNDAGKNIESVRYLIRYSTSEVGNSAMRVTPIFNIDGTLIPFGSPVEVRHDAGNSIDHIKKSLPMMGTMIKEAEDAVENLGNTPIKHPGGCFTNIVDTITGLFSKKEVEKKASELDMAYPTGCDAIDIYLAMVELVDDTYPSSKDIARYIKASEAVSKKMTVNYTFFDKEVVSK